MTADVPPRTAASRSTLTRRDALVRGAGVAAGATLASWAAPAFASVTLAQGIPSPQVTAGCRMTGGGKVLDPQGVEVDTGFLTHGFELHCNPAILPNNLQINWSGNSFHLETLLVASCTDDPTLEPNPPDASFDTYHGEGTGDLRIGSGPPESGSAIWDFTDSGEPGVSDKATITVFDSDGNQVLFVSGDLTHGNHQAHDTGRGCP